MPLDAHGNVVITPVKPMVVPTGFKGIAVSYGGQDPGAAGITVNGNPATTNYQSPSHGATHLHGNWGPVNTPVEPEEIGNQGISTWDPNPSSYDHPMSAQFIHDTYDPELGYERGDSPGDNPYISNFVPKQFGYMNDPSTLSPEELAYRNVNIKGLDDRQNTIENPGALLNDYIFSIKQDLRGQTPETRIGTIGSNEEEYDDNRYREDYDSYDEGPYSRYDSSRYY